MVNEENRCPGCMAELDPGNKCSHCGWEDGNAPDSPLYLKPGTLLNDKYLIGRVLGHGGFGITYLAWDTGLKVKLAIKEYLPRELATRMEGSTQITLYLGYSRERFEFGLNKFIDEARNLAQFEDQTGIVSVRDFFSENQTAYFVMPYIEGLTLKDFIRRKGGRLSYALAAKIMFPVIRALGQVHKAGMLHRDISPDNIYITKTGQVKILDFGAARYSMGEQSMSLSVILKPGYAPEEQYRPKGRQGPWTDVYAAAATFYAALLGRTPPDALDRLENDSLVPPSQQGADIPSNAEEALIKAMSVRAQDRYQSMEEFLDDLIRPTQPTSAPSPQAPAGVTPAAGPEQAPSNHTPTMTLPGGRSDTGKSDSPQYDTAAQPAPRKRKGVPFWGWLLIVVTLLLFVVIAGSVIKKARLRQKPPPPLEMELAHFPADNLDGVINTLFVNVDPDVGFNGGGSLTIQARMPMTIWLYEIENLDIRKAMILYQAKVKTEDLKGKAYLEMTCHLKGMGEFFSRGLNTALTGTTDWSSQEIPFIVKKGHKLTKIDLKLVVVGRGRVWIDDIHLLKRRLPEQWQ